MEPFLPSLADEIAEPRPDMNIKVSAFKFTESKIFYYIKGGGNPDDFYVLYERS